MFPIHLHAKPLHNVNYNSDNEKFLADWAPPCCTSTLFKKECGSNVSKCTVDSMPIMHPTVIPVTDSCYSANICYTQNLGPQKLVKKLSSRQIFDEPNPSPRWWRKRQAFDDPENHSVKNLSKRCQKFVKNRSNDKKTLDELKFVRLKTQTSHIDCFLTTLTTREILRVGPFVNIQIILLLI